jgi:sialate O-acetylesterase
MRPTLHCLSLAFLLLDPRFLRADVQLPTLFSEHAVLMKSESVPVWGKAEPGEEVTVALAGISAHAITNQEGRWSVSLNLKDTTAGPFEMIVKGKNEIVIPDVAVGAVWLASGQSNMERILKVTANAPKVIAKSSNALLRQFRVEKAARPTPADDCKGRWTVAGPETAGDFTAVGYYFGKQLQEVLTTPVGIINASWGGTFSEAWTSLEALNRVESLQAGEAARRKIVAEYPIQRKRFVTEFAQWLKAHGREDKAALNLDDFAGAQSSTHDWSPVSLPGKIFADGLPATGAVWLRRNIEIPESALLPGLEFKVLLGRMDGFEQVYWNGKKVSETTYAKLPGSNYTRYFSIPADLVKPGANTLAVRIYSPALPPSISVNPLEFKAGPVSLNGEWVAKWEYQFPALPEAALSSVPPPPLQPPGLMGGAIFNGVINPLIPYALDGIIWYQGESNTGRADQYRVAFPLLIEDWRRRWNRGDLPFYFCQLANYLPKRSTPAESEWAELRESQTEALHLPRTGQAVLIDLGEAGDIHPRNKKDAGDRLARLALAGNYGKEVVSSGPVFDSVIVEGASIRIRFTHTDRGLIARTLPEVYDVSTLTGKTAPLVRNSPQSQVEGFSICGEDRRWVWAEAKIEGESVVVWSEKVAHPIAVRYAWADNPTCNLYNGAGLPAGPFRTDHFPEITANKQFGPGS